MTIHQLSDEMYCSYGEVYCDKYTLQKDCKCTIIGYIFLLEEPFSFFYTDKCATASTGNIFT